MHLSCPKPPIQHTEKLYTYSYATTTSPKRFEHNWPRSLMRPAHHTTRRHVPYIAHYSTALSTVPSRALQTVCRATNNPGLITNLTSLSIHKPPNLPATAPSAPTALLRPSRGAAACTAIWRTCHASWRRVHPAAPSSVSWPVVKPFRTGSYSPVSPALHSAPSSRPPQAPQPAVLLRPESGQDDSTAIQALSIIPVLVRHSPRAGSSAAQPCSPPSGAGGDACGLGRRVGLEWSA